MLVPRASVDDGNLPLVYNTYNSDKNGKFWLRCRRDEVGETEAVAREEDEQVFSPDLVIGFRYNCGHDGRPAGLNAASLG